MRVYLSLRTFFAGGANSIRGFAFRGVGPIDVEVQVNKSVVRCYSLQQRNIRCLSTVIWSEVLFLLTQEKRIPIRNDLNFSNFRATIGFGFRAKVPFMGNSVVSVDFGFPVIRKDKDDEQAVTFNFGGR